MSDIYIPASHFLKIAFHSLLAFPLSLQNYSYTYFPWNPIFPFEFSPCSNVDKQIARHFPRSSPTAKNGKEKNKHGQLEATLSRETRYSTGQCDRAYPPHALNHGSWALEILFRGYEAEEDVPPLVVMSSPAKRGLIIRA